MKGLLLKDLYMMKAYCKSYALFVVVFLAASLINGNAFFIYYPCLMCGMIPLSLLSYDERSRFIQYSVSLPVTRAQTVSAKYLVGLFTQGAVLIVAGIVQGLRMKANGSFVPDEFAVMMLSMLVVSMLASAIPLPFVFRYGVEKGRIALYVMVGFVCASAVLLSKGINGMPRERILPAQLFAILAVLGIGVFALSWYLSVAFYKKREL